MPSEQGNTVHMVKRPILLSNFRKRTNAARAVRRMEKKMADAVMQLEDERGHVDQYKDQVRSLFSTCAYIVGTHMSLVSSLIRRITRSNHCEDRQRKQKRKCPDPMEREGSCREREMTYSKPMTH